MPRVLRRVAAGLAVTLLAGTIASGAATVVAAPGQDRLGG